ncbi:MAG TPA: FAD-binding and (Fe-S)-binding domain-containing protein [Anaerolineales bacterium]|nr:FAD-binding and (Fe-S)-binding domain-containing protein [Anaerolineales bacterium]
MDLQAQLLQVLPSARIHTRLIDRVAYANDASYFHLVPQAVVQPNSIAEIQSLFRLTQQNKIPMTFRAGGTSLSGQAVTDGILVDISRHWGRYSVEDNAQLIRTQPGIVGGFLNNVLKPYGRRIGPDPASIDACMMGGILANNSSGMCCGVTENAYRTIHSMTFVLPNGLVINTADPDAATQLHEGAPEIESGLLELKRRLIDSPAPRFDSVALSGKGKGVRGQGETLAERVRRRYQMKNNNGYLLNAFLDFDTPLDILTHLLIGSEGTLGFIAEAVLHTLPDYPRRYTGQLYFKSLRDAADAIAPIKASGARAVEIMDRAALHSVQHFPDVPAILQELPDEATAILVEYQAQDTESILGFKKEAEQVVRRIQLLHDPEFTEDPSAQASLWKTRKGIIPSIGGMRAPGSTCINEDVVFPIQRLAEAVTDLQHLFAQFNYPDGAVFGHAKDGNLHFLVNQAFNSEADVRHYGSFMSAIVEVVSGKYDGALKAEHGTGRNMAPFVATEWGDAAYAIMRDLKALLDPDAMLNPGVVINPDPNAHVTYVKRMAPVAPEVDKCIECGFCESRCPSRRLTLTPRQRIVVQREIARLKILGSDSTALDSMMEDFAYAGIDTCAADGMCATACPVGINTGDFTKHLRAASVRNEKSALWLADHFALTEKAIGWSVRLGHIAEKVIGANGVKSVSAGAQKLTGTTLPKWNSHIPLATTLITKQSARSKRGKSEGDRGEGIDKFIYFPSCISRQLGTPNLPITHSASLADTLITVAGRANVMLNLPDEVNGLCCGMPFASKGYTAAYKQMLHKTLHKFWGWSEGGKYPIVIDTTSCTHTLRTCADDLDVDDQARWKQLTILDSIEFLHDEVLPKLAIQPVDEEVILHPNCSARKLGLDSKLLGIAQKCSRSASIPLTLGCCAFAGDRGLLFPELTASATQQEAAEVNSRDYDGYYSSNIPCEIGMSEATGKDYEGIVYLVEKASDPGNRNQ